MHIPEGFGLLTPSAIALDFAVLLSAFCLGLFGYVRKIGGWGFFGILVIIFGGMRLMPDDGAAVTFLGLTGLTLGAVAGFFLLRSVVNVRRSTRTQKIWSGSSYAGATGSESFEWFDDEPYQVSAVQSQCKDYYHVLEIQRSATRAEIKLAYRRLMKSCHPDFFPGDKDKEAMAKEVNKAFEVLGDEQKRAAFDRYGFVA